MRPIFSNILLPAAIGCATLATSSASAQSQCTNTTSGTQQWNTAANWDTNPTMANAIGRLPTVTQSGGDLILNFNCLLTSSQSRGGLPATEAAASCIPK